MPPQDVHVDAPVGVAVAVQVHLGVALPAGVAEQSDRRRSRLVAGRTLVHVAAGFLLAAPVVAQTPHVHAVAFPAPEHQVGLLSVVDLCPADTAGLQELVLALGSDCRHSLVPTAAVGSGVNWLVNILRWWGVEPCFLLLPLVFTILVAVDAPPAPEVTKSNDASNDTYPKQLKHPSQRAFRASLISVFVIIVVLAQLQALSENK